MLKAVIFDMDGVIADTNPFHEKAFITFFKKYDITDVEHEFAEHMFGKHNSYIMSHFFKRPIHGEELAKLEYEKEKAFRDIYADEAKPVKGLIAFLQNLKNAHIKMGVATSAPQENMDLIIDKLGIRHYFSSMLSSADVKLHKPNPEVYLKSAENLGADPSECVVFEDSFSGITAGLNAGMKVTAVLTSHKKEELPRTDLSISNYTQISVDTLKHLFHS